MARKLQPGTIYRAGRLIKVGVIDRDKDGKQIGSHMEKRNKHEAVPEAEEWDDTVGALNRGEIYIGSVDDSKLGAGDVSPADPVTPFSPDDLAELQDLRIKVQILEKETADFKRAEKKPEPKKPAKKKTGRRRFGGKK